jgi:hypothetical protein
MANRYWVGGTGNWNSTTKWSTSSGGASGASVPTAADNAIFDDNSNTTATHYTATVTDNATCANLTFTPVAADGATEFDVNVGFVIAGTFSTSGTAGNRRAWFQSSTYGLMRDMQIATIGTVTDVDFRDIRVTGTAAPISGTRIGDLRGISGITASTPKTVYWSTAAGGSWIGDNWAATSGGAVSSDNFPLAQDVAIIDNTGLDASATITTPSSGEFIAVGTVNASTRTLAMTLSLGISTYYGDFTLGSGVTLSSNNISTFSGRNTQTITSSGKSFPGNITVDSYGGTVELADALVTTGSSQLGVTNGTFDTKNYNVTTGSIVSSGTNVRSIKLGSSTVTITVGLTSFAVTTNLTFDAGTSSIIFTFGSTGTILNGGGVTFYDVAFTDASQNISATIEGNNTYRNLSFTAPSSEGALRYKFSGNATITGTLTCAGASAVRRFMLQSSVTGTTRTLTVATLSANDCDFRDITIAGAAAGGSPSRAGDCGGNTGITFPAAKTSYWNLAGSQNWSSTAWATSSGGTPAVNNFPLAQDTVVFDETGSVTGAISVNGAWNIGTFNASARTSAMTFTSTSKTPAVYGDWSFGTGVTFLTNASGTITFSGRGTQTITSNGVAFGCPVTFDCDTGTVQLADALELVPARALALISGTFDAVAYNVTAGTHTYNTTGTTLKMGSGTFTVSGVGSVWTMSSATNLYTGTADILLSSTSASSRFFLGNGKSYNKLTIGGAAGTVTITGNNQFAELASTKTVAHTIDLGSNIMTFGAWTVTGTVGNVVTVTGTGVANIISGARVSGVDYLAMGTIGFNVKSPGEFYAGANSTGSHATTILTDAPAATTRYWIGGSGTWSATGTTDWSATSGGSGGASVPTSADAVVFDSASSSSGYTVTCTATQLRCGSLTFNGPASGNVTWAGTAPLAIHSNFTLPATGITRSYTGDITFSGSSTGRTITTNGKSLSSSISVNGVGCGWTLADAINNDKNFIVINGSFDTSNFSYTSTGSFSSFPSNSRTIDFGSSTVTCAGLTLVSENLTFTAGTSQINVTGTAFFGGSQTFHNVSLTSQAITTLTFSGENTFNNLTWLSNRSASGIGTISLSGDQTINGTLTLSTGLDATKRLFVRSSVLGTTRTLTCATFLGKNADFSDITIAGAAAPVSGTRLGDCQNNSGITFGAGVNKYWNLVGGGDWGGSIGWATSSGGTPAIDNFPLAQDTCFFEATGLNSGDTVTINASYNIGTIDMSARTSAMTLINTRSPIIYSNWINGTGVTLSGTGTFIFSGRGSQTITSAGRTFTQALQVSTPGGSVTLQDSFITNRSVAAAINLADGTFNANNYNVTCSGAAGGTAIGVSSSNNIIVNLAIGSGTWTIAGAGNVWNNQYGTSIITGTGTINLTSTSNKNFLGGSSATFGTGSTYTNITLNQGGAGKLTITYNNSFADISNSAGVATIINLNNFTQTVGAFTASGTDGNVLTIEGASATNPCTLIYTGVGQVTTDYLTLTGVRAYPLVDAWSAGSNSTNNGTLGWVFPVPTSTIDYGSTIYYGSTNITSIFYGSTAVSEIYYGSLKVF